MKSIKNEFPNPVLAAGRDDYTESCRFYTTFREEEIEVDSENIVIPVKYVLDCKGLSKKIHDGQAVAIVSVKSSAASYSRLFKFPKDGKELTISVPKFSVVNKMDITGSVIAASNIDDFRCDGEFNDLYFGSSTFEIRKGDILATEESRTIFVDDSELERPISSIFAISRNDEQGSAIVPNFYGEKIEIFLKSELYELYYEFKDFNNGSLRRYATGIIVYPVLIEAISYVVGYYQNDGEVSDGTDYSEKRWFRAIVHKTEEKGMDLRTYQGCLTTLANDILGDIALDALKGFKDTLDSEINSGETQMIGGID